MSVEDAKRSTFKEMDEQTFMLWRHNPISAAFLQFIQDQADNYRVVAADAWESGMLNHLQGENADVLRGRCLALRELHEVTAQSIQSFYGYETRAETDTQE